MPRYTAALSEVEENTGRYRYTVLSPIRTCIRECKSSGIMVACARHAANDKYNAKYEKNESTKIKDKKKKKEKPLAMYAYVQRHVTN